MKKLKFFNIEIDIHPSYILVYMVGAMILATALLRLVFGAEAEVGRFDKMTLCYFLGAAAVFILPLVNSIKFSNGQLELDLRQKIKEAELATSIALDASKVVSSKTSSSVTTGGKIYTPGSVVDDPWKGVFGGKYIDKDNGRTLSAEVIPLSSAEGWYAVVLKVSPTRGAKPLQGEVQFYLHDSFTNNRPVVKVMQGQNQAVLHLKAWGAFTVGAVCDGGQCELELDLAQLESAPKAFRFPPMENKL